MKSYVSRAAMRTPSFKNITTLACNNAFSLVFCVQLSCFREQTSYTVVLSMIRELNYTILYELKHGIKSAYSLQRDVIQRGRKISFILINS